MPTAKLNKRSIDALKPPGEKQFVLWDSEIRGFGVRVLPSGLKTFIIQYRNAEGIKRRVNIGRFGVITAEQARDLAKIKLGAVAAAKDPADEARRARNEMNVAELCDWYLTEAHAGRILGQRNRPIKEFSLAMDESRIRTHIKPLIGKRIARHLTIADVEEMQNDVATGKTKKPRTDGRGGKATGGPGVAASCLATLQAILGHAKRKGLLAEHPTKGAKKLAGNKKTRRLSVAEIEALGKAMLYAEQQGVSLTGIAVIRLLLLTGYRREEGQAMQRALGESDGRLRCLSRYQDRWTDSSDRAGSDQGYRGAAADGGQSLCIHCDHGRWPLHGSQRLPSAGVWLRRDFRRYAARSKAHLRQHRR